MAFKTTSLADQVFEKLETDILLGVYPRGSVLTELRLTEQLGVSRTPIREAIRRLEQERLIEETGRGMLVLGVTYEDLLDILYIRRSVEALATGFAAEHVTQEELEQLRHILDLQEFYFGKADTDQIRRMDDAFHELICRFSRHTVISDTLLPLHRKTARYRRAAIDRHKSTGEVLKEHRKIFDALCAHDRPAAEAAAQTHIDNARKRMIERTEENG